MIGIEGEAGAAGHDQPGAQESQPGAYDVKPAQRSDPGMGGEQGGEEHDQDGPEIVDQIGIGGRGILDTDEIEQVIAKEAADPERPGPGRLPEMLPGSLAAYGPDDNRHDEDRREGHGHQLQWWHVADDDTENGQG